MLSPHLTQTAYRISVLVNRTDIRQEHKTAVLGFWIGFVLGRSVTLNLDGVDVSSVHCCGWSLISFIGRALPLGWLSGTYCISALACLSALHRCPIAPMDMIMYMVSSVAYNDLFVCIPLDDYEISFTHANAFNSLRALLNWTGYKVHSCLSRLCLSHTSCAFAWSSWRISLVDKRAGIFL